MYIYYSSVCQVYVHHSPTYNPTTNQPCIPIICLSYSHYISSYSHCMLVNVMVYYWLYRIIPMISHQSTFIYQLYSHLFVVQTCSNRHHDAQITRKTNQSTTTNPVPVILVNPSGSSRRQRCHLLPSMLQRRLCCSLSRALAPHASCGTGRKARPLQPLLCGRGGVGLLADFIHWIGFVGKILTGNPWVFTIKYRAFRLKFFPSSNSMISSFHGHFHGISATKLVIPWVIFWGLNGI